MGFQPSPLHTTFGLWVRSPFITVNITSIRLGGYTRGYRGIKALWRRRLMGIAARLFRIFEFRGGKHCCDGGGGDGEHVTHIGDTGVDIENILRLVLDAAHVPQFVIIFAAYADSLHATAPGRSCLPATSVARNLFGPP